jgi:RNA polymerase sigma-70 factor (ECF subfamily)
MTEQVWRADEISLLQKARDGDAAAFELLFTHYQGRIYNYVYRLMGDADEAQDLTQDSFVKAFRALRRGDVPLNPAAWLYRIASHTCLDALRRRRLIRWLPLDGLAGLRRPFGRDSGDSPESSVVRTEEHTRIQQALERLPPRYRMLLLLREYEGLSHKEIAEVTGDSLSTVKVTLFRARERCRREYLALAGPGPGPGGEKDGLS